MRELVRAAAPLPINSLIFIGNESTHCPHGLPAPFSIKSFSIRQLSGLDHIDQRLTPHRLAYVVFSFGKIVHESWVCFDAPLPSQYGFDFRIPVVDRSITQDEYKGKGLFPYTLTYILRDLKKRRTGNSAYVLVSPTNNASIRGIQKAGFQFLAHLKGTRVLGLFIINKSIERASQLFGPQDINLLQPPIAS
jgi:hypothetical protein